MSLDKPTAAQMRKLARIHRSQLASMPNAWGVRTDVYCMECACIWPCRTMLAFGVKPRVRVSA